MTIYLIFKRPFRFSIIVQKEMLRAELGWIIFGITRSNVETICTTAVWQNVELEHALMQYEQTFKYLQSQHEQEFADPADGYDKDKLN